MPTPTTPLDDRPFRSIADLARETALASHYRNLAIPALVAVLQTGGGAAANRRAGRRNHEAAPAARALSRRM